MRAHVEDSFVGDFDRARSIAGRALATGGEPAVDGGDVASDADASSRPASALE